MKKNFFYAMITIMTVLTTACSSDDVTEDAQPTPKENETRSVAPSKTVLVYMAGRNSLSEVVEQDLSEMKEGSKKLGSNDNLLVFIRRFPKNEQPWLARVKNGEVTDSISLKDMGIASSDGLDCASDPNVMEGVMRYAFTHYPAMEGNYGLVLWGHGSGWLIEDEKMPMASRAFGVDKGNNRQAKQGRWINIPTIAKILKDMPHLKFIMADCCNFMCLENLYELREVCDYIIGSPAEIPDQGAPYNMIVPDMFADGKFYADIVDKYYTSVHGYLPLTAVQTSKMEELAQATRQTLQAVRATYGEGYADMQGLIHYYHTDTSRDFYPEYNIFYDAGDYFRAHAPKDAYQQWRQVLDQTIVEYRMAKNWNTDKLWYRKYADFEVTAEKFHGVSMFVPQDPNTGDYAKYNEDIQQMAWYYAVEQ